MEIFFRDEQDNETKEITMYEKKEDIGDPDKAIGSMKVKKGKMRLDYFIHHALDVNHGTILGFTFKEIVQSLGLKKEEIEDDITEQG